MAALQARTRELATTLALDLAEREQPVDLMEAFALRLPITVIGELLGIHARERQSFRSAANALLSVPTGDAAADPGAGWAALSEQVAGLIAAKREHPADDLLSGLIAVRDADSDRLTEAELVTLALTLITAGHVTTAAAIGLGAILLISHNQLAALAAHPERVPTAVEEVLRFQALGGDVARVATEELQLAGMRIAAGDKVIVSLTSANRDERHFAVPDRFDIGRTENPHLTYGHGIHHCLGAALARIELQTAFTALAAQFPGLRLAVVPGELTWQRSELFGDEWPEAVPVTW